MKRKRDEFDARGVFSSPVKNWDSFLLFKLNSCNKANTVREVCLPCEMWVEVMRHLSMYDLLKMRFLSRLFGELYKDNSLWKVHYLRLFCGGQLHIWPVGISSCRLNITSQEGEGVRWYEKAQKPVLVCNVLTHYINKNDGKKPTFEKNYLNATGSRIYERLIFNLENYEKTLAPGKSVQFITEVKRRNIAKKIRLTKRKLYETFKKNRITSTR